MMNKWIPVKESLPKTSGTYLVTVRCEFDEVDDAKMVIEAWYEVERGVIYSDKGWKPLYEFYDLATDIVPNIVAWMPLPKPYDEEQEDESEEE